METIFADTFLPGGQRNIKESMTKPTIKKLALRL